MSNVNRLGRRKFITVAGGAGIAALTGCASVQVSGSVPAGRARVQQSSCPFPIYLDSNENPYGPSSDSIAAAVKAVTQRSHRYARGQRDQLAESLADFYGLKSQQVLVGCGSIEILKIASDVFCSVEKPPVISDPVYEAVGYFAGLDNISSIKIPAQASTLGHDLEAMLDAAYEYRSLVYVCNPCNPTGSVLGQGEMTDFLRQIPPDVVVVVDEAYAEYADPGFWSCMEFVRQGMPNLAVVRTFSKMYGLAGLRVGYCAAHSDLIDRMAGHRLWNNLNQAGLAAALESLKDQSRVRKMAQENRRTRETFCHGLARLGYGYVPSQGCYVLITGGRPWEETHGLLRNKGVVAGRKIASMPEHVRISVGYAAEMDYVLEILS